MSFADTASAGSSCSLSDMIYLVAEACNVVRRGAGMFRMPSKGYCGQPQGLMQRMFVRCCWLYGNWRLSTDVL